MWYPIIVVSNVPAGVVTFAVPDGFKVMGENNTVIDELTNQRANEGTGQFTYKFDTPGEKALQITLETASGEDLGMFVESATFNLVVQ